MAEQKRFAQAAPDATRGPPSSETEDFLAEADVYKETAKSDLVVMRRTRLYHDSFVTFHNFEKDPNDKKAWFLDRKCVLVPAHEDALGTPVPKAIRPGGTWTIVAALQTPDVSVPVYSFTVEWPVTWAPAGYTSFTFGFKSEELARTWHRLLTQRIAHLAQEVPTHRRGRSGGMASELLARMSGGPATLFAIDPIASPVKPGKNEGSGGGAAFDVAVAGVPPKAVPILLVPAPAAAAPVLGTPAPPPPVSDGDSDEEERTRKAQRNRMRKSTFNKRWVPVRQTNGVAVYYHTNADDSVESGGEYMVSAIVRGTPKECLDVLVSPGSNTSILGPARIVEVLVPKSHESDKEVLRIVLDSPGNTSYLAPRELIVERMVRTDTEGHGLYAILFSSCTPPPGTQLASRSRASGWFRRPVLGTVRGGYTIAPLDAHKLVSSPESLVSFIVKVDMGGVCSERSWMYPLADAWGWTDALLDRVLMSVNLVRDEVEHARFALQPFMFETSETDEAASLAVELAEGVDAAPGSVLSPHGGLPSSMSASGRRSNVSMTGGKGLMRLNTRRSGTQGLMSPPSLGALARSMAAGVAEDGGDDDFGDCLSGTGTVDLEKMKGLATLDPKFWDSLHTPGKASPYSVRGPTYLKDKKKIPAGEPQFMLSSVELVAVDSPVDHIARFLPSVRQGGAPFSIIIHLIIPGTPVLALCIVLSHPTHPKFLGTPPQHPMEEEHQWSPFDFVLHKFVNGTDEVRNRMLKLIPHIADGSWLIKSSVGTVPVIIGKALKTRYTLTPTYLEVGIDITANHVANYVTGLVRGATTSLVIDFGFVLEGTTPWELPEFLLGAMRLWHLDVRSAKKLDTSAEIPLVLPGSEAPLDAPPLPPAAL